MGVDLINDIQLNCIVVLDKICRRSALALLFFMDTRLPAKEFMRYSEIVDC